MSARVTSRFCDCIFPSITHPGTCGKCKISHYDAQRICLRAVDIPYRFFANCELTYKQYERLRENIECITYATMKKLNTALTLIGEKSLLCYFQESILTEVADLLYQRHGLKMTQQDVNIFEGIDICEMMSKLRTHNE